MNVNQYQAFKNRKIDFNKPVKIYKNLHNGLFSIQQNNLVVAHVQNFTLDNVSFKVRESGRLKVLETKQKNIHAFICGTLISVNTSGNEIARYKQRISYNPYKGSCFYYCNDSSAIQSILKRVYGCCIAGLFTETN